MDELTLHGCVRVKKKYILTEAVFDLCRLLQFEIEKKFSYMDILRNKRKQINERIRIFFIRLKKIDPYKNSLNKLKKLFVFLIKGILRTDFHIFQTATGIFFSYCTEEENEEKYQAFSSEHLDHNFKYFMIYKCSIFYALTAKGRKFKNKNNTEYTKYDPYPL